MVNFIVCEFNPFHNGHAYLLEQIHRYPNICIMSSHVTQRGEFSHTDKWTRTEMALRCGADLVLELSAPFAMGNAQLFAEGALEIARATGLNGRFCFGTEGDVLSRLQALADISNDALSPTIKQLQRQGYSYAASLSAAYAKLNADISVLSTPNNVLALEYIRAGKDFSFFAVERQGVAHDSTELSDKFCSASALRNNPSLYSRYVPSQLHKLYRTLQSPDPAKIDLLWLHHLRTLTKEEWDVIAPDGIGRRFYKQVQTAGSIQELLEQVKTKCCTFASLRRLALKAFLGPSPCEHPQYIRVLGANQTGKELLAQMNPSLPLLVKPASVHKLSQQAQMLMEYESKLTDIYMFMMPDSQPKGLEYQTSPIIKNQA